MKVLVIAPHADDEVLGCGGTIHKHYESGDEVHVIIASNASIGAPELYSQSSIIEVRQEALAAHKILGIKNTIFLDLPAPRLDTFPEYQIANCFSSIINEIKPEILYLPHRGDIHKDHMAVFNAALVAVRPINNCTVKKILAYETLSETEWSAPFNSDYFIPNVYNNIECNLNAKIEAMNKYDSQIKIFPHSRSIRTIKALAEYRGSTVGYEAAESFMLIREVIN